MSGSNLLSIYNRLRDLGVAQSFSIAFTPRSGSTLLCRVLRGLSCGLPDEYFQYPYESNRLSVHNGLSSAEDVLSFIGNHTGNQIFSSKLSNDQRAHLDEHLERIFDGYRSLDDLLPNHRWVLLTRRDLIDQAISLFIAKKTGRWLLESGDQWDANAHVKYDYFGIFADLLYTASSALSLDAYFDFLGVTPFKLHYEDLIERPRQTLDGLFEYLKLRAPRPLAPTLDDGNLVRISQHAEGLYTGLRARFLEDLMNTGRTDRRQRLGRELANWDQFFIEEQWARASASAQ